MSRIGKQILEIPAGTEVTSSAGLVTVKGKGGTLSRVFLDDVVIAVADGKVTFALKNDQVENKALWGTYASHVKNMIEGVTNGYTRKLILEGVGFKSEVAGKDLKLALGFSHPVVVKIPEGLTATAEKNVITISGIDKESVGQFAAKIRAMKKPEPYKGKGFHYDDEVVRRKQGKKSA